MSDVDKQGRGGMRRSIRILLAVSLALNMLVIGAIGGMVFHGGPGGISMSERAMAYGPYTRALSHKDRKMIGRAMRAELGDTRRNKSEIRAGFAVLKAALTADVYDGDLVHQLLKDQQAAGMRRYMVGQRLLLERLEEMSPQERQTFAERLGGRRR